MDKLKQKIKNFFKYEDIKMYLALKGIVLFTSKEEFEILKGDKRVTIVSNCLHVIENILLSSIIHNGCGILCKKCTRYYRVENGKIIKKIYDNKDNNIIEGKSIMLLSNMLEKDFNVLRTHETCINDLIIKPKNINQDKWLPLQLKATKGYDSMGYRFSIKKKKYENCITILISLSDERFWMFDDCHNISNQVSISIGLTESKYSKYEINKKNISNVLLDLYNSGKNITIDKYNGMKPQSEFSLIEYEYRILRENQLDFINFEYPIIQHQCFDFIVNNHKIQEKVGNQTSKNVVKFDITKRKNNQKICYDKNDNDYYWLHMPNKRNFFVIPEKILTEEEYVAADTPKQLYILDSNENIDLWYNKFKFDYTNIDQEKLESLFYKNKSSKYEYNELDKQLQLKLNNTVNIKKKREENIIVKQKFYCQDCHKEISNYAKYCCMCIKRHQQKKFIVTKEDIENLILKQKMSINQISIKYNVGMTTVRDFCKKHDIILPAKLKNDKCYN